MAQSPTDSNFQSKLLFFYIFFGFSTIFIPKLYLFVIKQKNLFWKFASCVISSHILCMMIFSKSSFLFFATEEESKFSKIPKLENNVSRPNCWAFTSTISTFKLQVQSMLFF